jgi:hypothetical protein
MTWKTQSGHRYAVGAEAKLIRDAIAYVHEAIEQELSDPEEWWPFQVPVFDKLSPTAKLAILADLSEALLSETAIPSLTAITEGTVAAIYDAVRQLVTIECDYQKEESETDISMPPFYRSLVLEIAESNGPHKPDPEDDDPDPEEILPSPRCTDMSEWEWVIECIADRFLWDDDFLMTDEMLDAPPDVARKRRDRLGITRKYFLDDAPDPEAVDVAAARNRLKQLMRTE